MNLTRRNLLSGTAAALALAAKLPAFDPSAEPLFEEIPPSASGISWVHENAMSPNRYLPETMGPGVAFLDYENDGLEQGILCREDALGWRVNGGMDRVVPCGASEPEMERANSDGKEIPLDLL